MAETGGGPVLRRSLGLFDAVAIGLGAIIGGGVFVTLGLAVGVAGVWALAALVIAAGLAFLNALSSAQLAAAYPVSGGTYAYGRRVINDLTGFLAGWIFLIGTASADSAIALTFAAYMDFLAPSVSPRMVGAVIAAVVTVVSYFRLRYSAEVNNLLVVLKVLSLLIFIAVGVFFFSPARLQPIGRPHGVNILHAAAILFFAYSGYARIATLGEEVTEPQKTIPRAIVTALTLSVLLYVGTLLVGLGLTGMGLATSNAPLAMAMEATGIAAGVYIIAVGALIATSSVLLTDILGVSRVVFAMSRNRDLPYWLSAVHPAYGTPHRAVLVSGLVVVSMALFLQLGNLVEAASFGLLLYYAITNLAAYLLSEEKRRYHRALAVAGLVSCLALAAFLPWRTVVLELAAIAVGAACFVVARAISSRTGRA